MNALVRRLKRATCLLLGHRYTLIKRVCSGNRHIGCTRCGRTWSAHNETKSFLELDWELADMYRDNYDYDAEAVARAFRRKVAGVSE